MTFSFVLSNDIGWLRLRIPDRVEDDALFQDEELQSYLDDYASASTNARRFRALADAIDMIAGDAAMILNLKSGDDSVSSSTNANTLMARAAKHRAQADDADAASGGLFGFADIVVTDFQAREKLDAELLRDAV